MRPLSARFLSLSMVAFASTTLMHSAEPIDLAAVFRRTAELNASVLTGREAALQAHASADAQRAALLPNVSLRAEAVTVSKLTATQNPAAGRFDGQVNGSLSLLNLQQTAAYSSAKRGAEA